MEHKLALLVCALFTAFLDVLVVEPRVKHGMLGFWMQTLAAETTGEKAALATLPD